MANLGAVLVCVTLGLGGAALAQDKDTVIKNRAALMKDQSKNFGAVKAFLDNKGDLAGATAGATALADDVKKIPDVFPPNTAGPDPTGDWAAKPEIWTDWAKFLDIQKTAVAKAEALLAAVKGGDKGAIQTAFADMGKNACGACHTAFREKLKP
jgi:cytochrome c556